MDRDERRYNITAILIAKGGFKKGIVTFFSKHKELIRDLHYYFGGDYFGIDYKHAKNLFGYSWRARSKKSLTEVKDAIHEYYGNQFDSLLEKLE